MALPVEIIEFVKKKAKEEVKAQLNDVLIELEEAKDEISALKVEIQILKEGGNI